MEKYTKEQLLEAIQYWTKQLRLLEEGGGPGGGGPGGGCPGGGMGGGPGPGGPGPGPGDIGMGPAPAAVIPHIPSFGFGFPYAGRGFGIYAMNPYARMGYSSSKKKKKSKKKTKKSSKK